MAVEKINVQEDIYAENSRIAARNRDYLSGRGICTVNVLGAPGAGKTSTLVSLIRELSGKSSVIEGDVESDIDTRKLQSLGIPAFQINTFGGCHLDAPSIAAALEKFSVPDQSFLFIENIGNLICPADFDLGEHVTLLICAVTDGSDKPYKYPLAFERASAIIINKFDLAEVLDFDEEYFMRGVRALNPTAPVFKISARFNTNMAPLALWLSGKMSGMQA